MGLSLVSVAEQELTVQLQCHGFSIVMAFAVEHVGSMVVALHLDLVVPKHRKSSWSGAQTPVPCMGRRNLNNWTTRKSPLETLLSFM